MSESPVKLELISILDEVFRRRGYDGATLSVLSRACGLGKASLYHHFPGGKDEMADVLLQRAVAQLNDTRVSTSRSTGAVESAPQRIRRRLCGVLRERYAQLSGRRTHRDGRAGTIRRPYSGADERLAASAHRRLRRNGRVGEARPPTRAGAARCALRRTRSGAHARRSETVSADSRTVEQGLCRGAPRALIRHQRAGINATSGDSSRRSATARPAHGCGANR